MTTALLSIVYANGYREERSLPEGSYEIGRDSGALVLGDPGVSARHARLDVTNGQVWLCDLGSSNGTFDQAGARLTEPRAMRAHESFRLGASSITLLPMPGATRAMPVTASAQPMPNPVGSIPVQAGVVHPQPSALVPPDWSKYRYSNLGRALVFGVETGIVVGSETRSESHVSGYVSTQGGGRLNTQIVTKCEFYLRKDDGQQTAFWMSDINVVLRDGQRVSLLWGAMEDVPARRSFLRLVHHETQTLHRLDPAKKAALALAQAKVNLSTGGCLVALLGTAAMLVVTVMLEHQAYQLLWLPAAAGLIVWGLANNKNDSAIMRLDAHAEQVGNQLLAFVIASKRGPTRAER